MLPDWMFYNFIIIIIMVIIFYTVGIFFALVKFPKQAQFSLALHIIRHFAFKLNLFH